jgi:hypothetical protein
VPLFRRRVQRLGEDDDLRNAQGDFTGFRPEQGAGRLRPVSKIDQLERAVVGILAQIVLADVEL